MQERQETEVKYNFNSYSQAYFIDLVEELGSEDDTGTIRNVKGRLPQNIEVIKRL